MNIQCLCPYQEMSSHYSDLLMPHNILQISAQYNIPILIANNNHFHYSFLQKEPYFEN